MGEGLGGWGHATRRQMYKCPNRPDVPFVAKLFLAGGPGAATPPGREGASAPLDRQIDMAAIGKLKITQLDTAATAFDHESSSDRETTGQTRN
jgi:hypothetical protein